MIGETIGRFELRSRLGAGPFGEVWLAGHRETQAAVAIKLLHPDVSALPAIPAFVNATRAIARIASAYVAKVLDAGIGDDGRAYVVSELVLGQTLGQRIAQGRLSQTQVADVVAQVARALVAAQGVGVVHHDLKPSNVLLVPDPDRASGERAVVLDFGLAPLVAAGLERAAPAYVAPELWSRGESPRRRLGRHVRARLPGVPDGGGPAAVPGADARARCARSTCTIRRRAVRSQMPDIGAVLDQLVARMLEKRPGGSAALDEGHRQAVRSARGTGGAARRDGARLAAKSAGAGAGAGAGKSRASAAGCSTLDPCAGAGNPRQRGSAMVVMLIVLVALGTIAGLTVISVQGGSAAGERAAVQRDGAVRRRERRRGRRWTGSGAATTPGRFPALVDPTTSRRGRRRTSPATASSPAPSGNLLSNDQQGWYEVKLLNNPSDSGARRRRRHRRRSSSSRSTGYGPNGAMRRLEWEVSGPRTRTEPPRWPNPLRAPRLARPVSDAARACTQARTSRDEP